MPSIFTISIHTQFATAFCWILVSLGVFRAKRQYLKYACIGYDNHVFISLKPAHCVLYLCVFKRSPLGVKICLSHAQIGLL